MGAMGNMAATWERLWRLWRPMGAMGGGDMAVVYEERERTT